MKQCTSEIVPQNIKLWTESKNGTNLTHLGIDIVAIDCSFTIYDIVMKRESIPVGGIIPERMDKEVVLPAPNE